MRDKGESCNDLHDLASEVTYNHFHTAAHKGLTHKGMNTRRQGSSGAFLELMCMLKSPAEYMYPEEIITRVLILLENAPKKHPSSQQN